ncbi:MAG: phosphoribosylanthranilate isomerase [Candidatus Omnitrophica bacterium]|nr:phosphoribosylanthranilate isomerase [Candidatus Omnitrophota bacterium]
MGVKVKICGITNLEDAQASVDAGCDALGFVFYKKSPRYIAPERAKKIIRGLPQRIIKIGVFVNEKEKFIKRIAKACCLDMLQFHGNESAEFCSRFKVYKIIKAFRVKNKIELNKIKKYRVFAYLFDTFVKSKIGGTGKTFDWKLLGRLDTLNKTIFLSGGLTAKNVKAAIKAVRPDWVDASSSLEKSPGKKEHKKVRTFIKAIKG